MIATDPFDRSVIAPLRRLGRRARFYTILEGLGLTLIIWVVLVSAQYALDRLLRLETGPRAALSLAIAALVLNEMWRRVLRPMVLDIPPSAMAAVIERRDPSFRDALISAVQYGRQPSLDPRRTSPAFVRLLIANVAARFDLRTIGPLFRAGRIWRRASLGALAIAIVVGAALTDQAALAVFFSRNVLLADTPWPSRTRLVPVGFRGGALRWPRGDPLPIVVRTEGETPRYGLRLRYLTAEGGRGERVMAAVGQREYRVDFGTLDSSMSLHFVIGAVGVDEQSDEYRVVAIDRPAARAVNFRISPPAYTQQEPFDWPTGQASGDILIGSRVDLTVEPTKPLKSAGLTFAGEPLGEASPTADGRWTIGFTPARSGSYALELTDEDQLRNQRPVTFLLRLIQDKPPKVRLQLPGAGELIVPGAVLRLAAEFEDNIGLASAHLVYQVERTTASLEETPTTAPVTPATGRLDIPRFEPHQTRLSDERRWPLADLNLQPNDRLSIHAEAADFSAAGEDSAATDSGPSPSVGRSVAYTLRVVTREELLAELARRESEWRQEFEQVLKLQEQIQGELAALREPPAENAPETPPRPAAYRDLERRQRTLATRLGTVRRQFQGILSELEINQLAGPPVRRRLDGGIIAPLGELVATLMPDAANLTERLRSTPDDQTAAALAKLQDRIVGIMRTILTNMLKWEGLNEAVAMLQELLKLQANVHDETRAELERQIDELFGGPQTTQPVDE